VDEHLDLAKQADELEQVWSNYHPAEPGILFRALVTWLAARRAARAAGYVEVLVAPATRPLDTALYSAMRGEPSAKEGWVWVTRDQDDDKLAVLLSREAVAALRAATGEWGTFLDHPRALRLLARDLAALLKEEKR